jgi:ubiquinone/menaquinone biosynthesis C-methylase UbiE
LFSGTSDLLTIVFQHRHRYNASVIKNIREIIQDNKEGYMEDYYDPKRRVRLLDSEDRARWLKVDDLIKNKAGITRGMTCIDLGSGTGVISFPLASAVGNTGKVYAVDISDEVIGRIREKNPPSNLVPVVNDAGQTGLENQIADVCFMILILHEVEQPEKILAEAFRLLKPGGKALALEWREDFDSPHPPHNERITREMAEQLFKNAGFSSFDYTEWSRSHYVATGSKYSTS